MPKNTRNAPATTAAIWRARSGSSTARTPSASAAAPRSARAQPALGRSARCLRRWAGASTSSGSSAAAAAATAMPSSASRSVQVSRSPRNASSTPPTAPRTSSSVSSSSPYTPASVRALRTSSATSSSAAAAPTATPALSTAMRRSGEIATPAASRTRATSGSTMPSTLTWSAALSVAPANSRSRRVRRSGFRSSGRSWARLGRYGAQAELDDLRGVPEVEKHVLPLANEEDAVRLEGRGAVDALEGAGLDQRSDHRFEQRPRGCEIG